MLHGILLIEVKKKDHQFSAKFYKTPNSKNQAWVLFRDL